MPNPVVECVVCSRQFELQPKKPGFANRCPECSAPKPLDPAEARKARLESKRLLIESAIRQEIAAKRLAESCGKMASAAICEERILQLLKMRIKAPSAKP